MLKQKSKGFLSANYQQITPYNYSIETGQRFNHYAFELDGTPILKTGLLAKQEQLNKILRNNLNAGFPFYRIKTDSIVSDEKINTVYLSSNSGSFVVNGEIKTKQNVVKQRVLANLMSWKKGDAFQISAWENIKKQINQTAYLSLKSSPKLYFENDTAKLILPLTLQQANQIDMLIGLQNNNDKTELIANVNLNTYNLFKRTDFVKINWQTPKKRTQVFDLEAQLPQLLKSQFGYYINLNLLKQDTLFFQNNSKHGIVFKPNLNTSLTVYYVNNKTSPIGKSAVTSTSQNGLGLLLAKQSLNSIFAPTKGHSITLDYNQGKQINTVNEQSVESKTQTFTGEFHLYSSLYKRFILLQKVEGGYINNVQITNEQQFFIGGFNSFRGVNERFYQASEFIYYSFNPRFMIDNASFAEVFFDYVIYDNRANYSLGSGFAFNTGNGIFKLNYAIAQNNGFKLKNGLVHFGYISLF